MPRKERVREVLAGLPTTEYLQERVSEGWRPIAFEWERDVSESAYTSEWVEEVPYGLQVSDDCSRLVENPAETEVIVLALDMIVDDSPLSNVAEKLNRSGYRMRNGGAWTPSVLFNLLPRMIEVGPKLFATQRWAEKRQGVARGA